MSSHLGELIARADPAELLAEVERCCARRDWDALIAVRDACDAAAESGKQLWPVSQFAEYRLALEAPAQLAAAVVRSGAARFALGPLTEVVAQSHRWADLADHLADPHAAAVVAHERVLRGEDLAGDARLSADDAGAPLALQTWEGDYPLPTYRSDELLENGPPPPAGAPQEVTPVRGDERDDPRLVSALRDIAGAWTEESNGDSRAAVVDGDVAAVVGALWDIEVGATAIEPGDALARIAWAGASGGAHGRRRGMSAGRATAFWCAHLLTDLAFPADPDQLGEAVAALRWWAIAPPDVAEGWGLRLAVEHPAGWSAAVDAWDADES